jgi:polyisoprenoid-binding protein YceI
MGRSKLVFLLGLLVFGPGIWAQSALTPVDSESKIAFNIRNLGINVNGTFNGMQGTMVFDPENPLSIKVNISVDASTINTGIGARDKHLRKEDYFGVETFKKISFISSSAVNSTKEGTYILQGDLTIKNTTKRVAIPFTFSKMTNGFLFKGTFKLNRQDYGVGGDSFSLSDEVTLNLSVKVK